MCLFVIHVAAGTHSGHRRRRQQTVIQGDHKRIPNLVYKDRLKHILSVCMYIYETASPKSNLANEIKITIKINQIKHTFSVSFSFAGRRKAAAAPLSYFATASVHSGRKRSGGAKRWTPDQERPSIHLFVEDARYEENSLCTLRYTQQTHTHTYTFIYFLVIPGDGSRFIIHNWKQSRFLDPIPSRYSAQVTDIPSLSSRLLLWLWFLPPVSGDHFSVLLGRCIHSRRLTARKIVGNTFRVNYRKFVSTMSQGVRKTQIGSCSLTNFTMQFFYLTSRKRFFPLTLCFNCYFLIFWLYIRILKAKCIKQART